MPFLFPTSPTRPTTLPRTSHSRHRSCSERASRPPWGLPSRRSPPSGTSSTEIAHGAPQNDWAGFGGHPYQIVLVPATRVARAAGISRPHRVTGAMATRSSTLARFVMRRASATGIATGRLATGRDKWRSLPATRPKSASNPPRFGTARYQPGWSN